MNEVYKGGSDGDGAFLEVALICRPAPLAGRMTTAVKMKRLVLRKIKKGFFTGNNE